MTNNLVRLSGRNSRLNKRCWAVIAVHYVNYDLTHAEAVAEAKDLRRRKQRGVAVVTNNAAKRMLNSQPVRSKIAA
jgi:hypothetical protein